MFRTRVMVMRTQSCLPRHCDNHPRIHIPVWTFEEQCFVIVQNTIYHLRAGQAYFVDTTKLHSAMNGHTQHDRVHIVGSVYGRD